MDSRKWTLTAAVIVVIFVVLFGYYYWSATEVSPPPIATATTAGSPTAKQDVQRLSDMHNLQEALAGYFKDHGAYPATPAGADCKPGYNNVGNLSDALVPKYIQSIPKDPDPAACEYNYQYWSDEKSYGIVVRLNSINANKYHDRWCLGAASDPPPAALAGYGRCP